MRHDPSPIFDPSINPFAEPGPYDYLPGPWEVPEQNAISGISVKQARRFSGAGPRLVCRVPLGPHDDSTAKLIAKAPIAPKLAAALQATIDITRDHLIITPQLAARIQRIACDALAEWEKS